MRCRLVYTPEEYETIRAGHIAEHMTDLFHIFAEQGELFFVNRSGDAKLEYKDAFERRGSNWVLARISLELGIALGNADALSQAGRRPVGQQKDPGNDIPEAPVKTEDRR